MNKAKQRNIIIIGLSSIVLLMAIGYAAFQTVLNIQGTSNISSTWDVQITGIAKDKTKGNITEISEPTFDKESASFKVGLESPGDYIYYKVAVTNKGSLAAIAKLGSLTCGKSNALQCGAYADSNVGNIETNTDLTERRLIIGPNETEYYNVWIKYNNEITEQPDVTNIDIKLTLTYEQSDVGITHTTEDECYTGKVLGNGTLTITDYDEKCGTDVVIPETIDGYTVTEIQDGKWDSTRQDVISPFSNKNIKNLIIPKTITQIGRFAFYGNDIVDLEIPDNVITIKDQAFIVNNISSLRLNAGLKSIESNAFYHNNLTEINIPNTVTYLGGGAFAFNNVSKERAIIYGRNSDGTENRNILNSYAGKNADGLIIPETIETIDSRAFRNVYLNSIDIPSNVKNINLGAFYCATQLSTLTLHEGLKYIGQEAFKTNNLTKVEIPNSVETIGNEAFGYNKLKTVTIGTGIKTIGTNAFQTTGTYNPITSITINKKEGSITGSPWGATKAQINWTGTR